jgi:hypothetical protein
MPARDANFFVMGAPAPRPAAGLPALIAPIPPPPDPPGSPSIARPTGSGGTAPAGTPGGGTESLAV